MERPPHAPPLPGCAQRQHTQAAGTRRLKNSLLAHELHTFAGRRFERSGRMLLARLLRADRQGVWGFDERRAPRNAFRDANGRNRQSGQHGLSRLSPASRFPLFMLREKSRLVRPGPPKHALPSSDLCALSVLGGSLRDRRVRSGLHAAVSSGCSTGRRRTVRRRTAPAPAPLPHTAGVRRPRRRRLPRQAPLHPAQAPWPR